MIRRWIVIALGVIALASQAEAATAIGPYKKTKSRYETIVVIRKNGNVTYRQTYPGYINGFPPPAFLYYGYPQSGHTHGVGF